VIGGNDDISFGQFFHPMDFEVCDELHEKADNGAQCSIFHASNFTISGAILWTSGAALWVSGARRTAAVWTGEAVLSKSTLRSGQKKWRMVSTMRHVRWTLLYLFPQIIVGGSGLEGVLRTVFIEHSLEDRHIAGSHVDDLKAHIVGIGIHMVRVAPFTAGYKHHRIFIGDIGGQLDLHPKILPGRDLFGRIQPEPACADIGQVTNELFGQIVRNLHVVGEVTTRDFAFIGHNDRSFSSDKYMTTLINFQ
jgi:hypothetical protein